MGSPIQALTSSPQTAYLLELDPELRDEFSDLTDVEYKKNAWKVAAIVSLALSGGTLFLFALLFYCISNHYKEVLEKLTDSRLKQELNKVKTDMKKDLSRGSELVIDGTSYVYDPKRKNELVIDGRLYVYDPNEKPVDDLIILVIRHLTVTKKLDPLQLLMALKLAHQGMKTLPLRQMQLKIGEKYPPLGGNFMEKVKRKVSINTHGKNITMHSKDPFQLIVTNDQGMLIDDNAVPIVKLQAETTLDLSTRKVKMLFTEELEDAAKA